MKIENKIILVLSFNLEGVMVNGRAKKKENIIMNVTSNLRRLMYLHVKNVRTG